MSLIQKQGKASNPIWAEGIAGTLEIHEIRNTTEKVAILIFQDSHFFYEREG
jgi:hypothetical protein